jgi:hypothetical protein
MWSSICESGNLWELPKTVLFESRSRLKLMTFEMACDETNA